MMVQTILVIGLFLLATAFLTRKLYLTIKGKGQQGCEKCAVNTTPATKLARSSDTEIPRSSD